MESNFRYNGTDLEVLPGDVVRINRLFRKPLIATVTYIPGLSAFDSSIGGDQWSYKVKGGSYYVAGYDPRSLPYTSRSFSLVNRASDTDEENWQSFKAPPEQDSSASIASEMTFLLLIWLAIFAVIAGIKWVL